MFFTHSNRFCLSQRAVFPNPRTVLSQFSRKFTQPISTPHSSSLQHTQIHPTPFQLANQASPDRFLGLSHALVVGSVIFFGGVISNDLTQTRFEVISLREELRQTNVVLNSLQQSSQDTCSQKAPPQNVHQQQHHLPSFLEMPNMFNGTSSLGHHDMISDNFLTHPSATTPQVSNFLHFHRELQPRHIFPPTQFINSSHHQYQHSYLQSPSEFTKPMIQIYPSSTINSSPDVPFQQSPHLPLQPHRYSLAIMHTPNSHQHQILLSSTSQDSSTTSSP